MSALMPTLNENGRPLAEASGTPVVTDQGPSHHGDTVQDTLGSADEQASVVLPPLTPMETVNLGMHRMAQFMDEFIARFDARALRAEARRTAPLRIMVQCRRCGTPVLASESIIGDFCTIECADAFDQDGDA